MGKVELTWRKEDEQLILRWTESGGPPVERPARRGFGQRLLYSVLAGELKAKCDIDFAPGGLVIDVLAPMTADVFPQLEGISRSQAESV